MPWTSLGIVVRVETWLSYSLVRVAKDRDPGQDCVGTTAGEVRRFGTFLVPSRLRWKWRKDVIRCRI
jgi:hypothetical protein